MRPKLVLIFAILAALLIGVYAGHVLTIKRYILVYETRFVLFSSKILNQMDNCLDLDDDDCIRLALGLLINSENARAQAILSDPISSALGEDIKEQLLELDELQEKYDPDA